jgi:hypothetical protein
LDKGVQILRELQQTLKGDVAQVKAEGDRVIVLLVGIKKCVVEMNE